MSVKSQLNEGGGGAAHRKLSEEMRDLLLADGDGLTMAQIVERVGDRGFGLLLIVLSLPSALPLPAAGYSVPFGIVLLVLALQMLLGRPHPVFPQSMGRRALKRATAERLLNSAAWLFTRIEWLVRPRLRWVGQRPGRLLMGMLVLVMAVLMLIPIPLTNTFPAMVIFLIGVGLSEDDGLFAIGACLVGVFAVCLYAALVWALIVYGPEVVVTIKDTIRGWLGQTGT